MENILRVRKNASLSANNFCKSTPGTLSLLLKMLIPIKHQYPREELHLTFEQLASFGKRLGRDIEIIVV